MPQQLETRYLSSALDRILLTALIIVLVEASALLGGFSAHAEEFSVKSDGERVEVSQVNSGVSFRGELKGIVEFDEDESTVVSLSPKSRLKLEETRRAHRYRLEVTPGPGSEPHFEWSVDGEPRGFDDEARRWLAEATPRFLRLSGVGAETRVARLLARGGAGAVFEEIGLISTGSVQANYIGHLFEQADLTSQETAKALEIAAKQVGTDSEMVAILAGVKAESLADPSVRRSFAEAAKTVGGDEQLRRALSRICADPGLPAEALAKLLGVSETIGGDDELAGLLKSLARSLPAEVELPGAFFDAAATIGSDAEHREVLEAVAERPGLSTGELRGLLSSAHAIGADGEIARLLHTILTRQEVGTDLDTDFLAALDTVGSRSKRERLLIAWKR